MILPFRPIACLLARTLRPVPLVEYSTLKEIFSPENNLPEQGVLITANHYSATGFHAWWITILISAFVPVDIHWVVTAGWTNSGWLNGFTHWLFPRNARMFGFTAMPAMPPDPKEVEARAAAVRQVLRYARGTAQPVIGLAPEGGDSDGGVLGPLPAGVGRFMEQISKSCPLILPIGIWTENKQIYLKFGSPYQLDIPTGLSPDERDRWVGQAVMQHIAHLLPLHLCGEYKKPEGN